MSKKSMKPSTPAKRKAGGPVDDDDGYPDNALVAEGDPKNMKANYAKAIMRPTALSSLVVQSFVSSKVSQLNLMSLVDELDAQAALIKEGNLARCETMLISQAHALDSIFATLAIRAADNMRGGNSELADRYLRLGLKAQGQCRATLETLGNLKNPPVIYARQANFAHGPQQVNNGTLPVHAGKLENRQNKLSGANHELCADTRTQTATSGGDKKVAAMGPIYRTKNRGRKSKG